MFIYLFIYCHKDSEDKGFEGKKDMLHPKTYAQKKICHAPKPTPYTWWSFHTLSSKAQSGNNTTRKKVYGDIYNESP